MGCQRGMRRPRALGRLCHVKTCSSGGRPCLSARCSRKSSLSSSSSAQRTGRRPAVTVSFASPALCQRAGTMWERSGNAAVVNLAPMEEPAVGAWWTGQGCKEEPGRRRLSGAVAIMDAESPMAAEEVENLVLTEQSAFVGGADVATLRDRPRLSGIGALGLVEVLARLVEDGGVEVAAGEGAARYRVVPGERAALEDRLGGTLEPAAVDHLAWCAALVTASETHLVPEARRRGVLGRLCAEQANLEAGLDTALRLVDVSSATRLAVTLCSLWELRRAPEETASQLDELLGLSLGPDERIELLAGRARLALRVGELDTALRRFGEAVILAADGSGKLREARMGCELGLVRVCAGDDASARARLAHGLAELERLGAVFALGRACFTAAIADLARGEWAKGRSRLERALRLQFAVGDEPGHGRSRLARSLAFLFEGEGDRALEDAAAAAEALWRVGDEDDLADAVLVAAGALGHERLELAATSTRPSKGRTVFDWLGWRSALEAALPAALRRVPGRSGDLARAPGAPCSPKAAVRRLLEAAEERSAGGQVQIRVLGAFGVRRDGREAHLAPQVALLLKRLVLSPEGLPVKEVIDVLWPDASAERGRRRLRNLLARLSRAAGSVAVRREQIVRLAPGVVVDAARFETAASEAIAALRSGRDRQDALGLARGANDLYAGDLLPGDCYEAFALVPRERLRRLRLRLLDAAADAALAESSTALGETCLRLGLEADPADERRYVALAKLLAAAGPLRSRSSALGRERSQESWDCRCRPPSPSSSSSSPGEADRTSGRRGSPHRRDRIGGPRAPPPLRSAGGGASWGEAELVETGARAVHERGRPRRLRHRPPSE